ncbi:hypothetical protein CDOO_00855 [Corynebacterium doosanense CAU 212 = DSM 45436]|uniref:Uncharacterized protein n=1 Tax=Corynebacterium doosanense CAU 212 = DSM 45436 TaxID=558173 RepID=A0A097IJ20_9CORY|nr:hypothetical protein CDOO_00855 [Corynebacterium doosanense CAU 212 = DSM 45436]
MPFEGAAPHANDASAVSDLVGESTGELRALGRVRNPSGGVSCGRSVLDADGARDMWVPMMGIGPTETKMITLGAGQRRGLAPTPTTRPAGMLTGG